MLNGGLELLSPTRFHFLFQFALPFIIAQQVSEMRGLRRREKRTHKVKASKVLPISVKCGWEDLPAAEELVTKEHSQTFV